MQALKIKPRRTIVERLDAIETSRRAALRTRYQADYPELDETETARLAELLATTRIRLIAESALACLTDEQVDEVLGRFEE